MSGRSAGFHPLSRAYQGLLRVTGKLYPQALFHVEHVQDRVVALTIDDGPSPRSAELLDLLQLYSCRATFFLHTGALEREAWAREIAVRMNDEGHEIANHMPEDQASILFSPEEFASEFLHAHESLTALGFAPRFFRAPRGFFHVDRMMPCLKRLAYYQRFIMASYLPWDVYLPLPRSYAHQLAAGAFPGAIFVLHDDCPQGSRRLDRTLETLALLLPMLTSQGYRLEPLGSLIGEVA